MVLAVAGSVSAGYASGSDSTNDVNNGGSYGYGYSGSFSGSSPGGNAPIQPVPQFNFDGFLNGYFDTLRKFNDDLMKNLQQQAQLVQQQAQQAAQSGYGQGQGQGQGQGSSSGFGGSFSGADGGAVASGSIGPGGAYQTAAVYPENPNSPNVVSRFSENADGGATGGANGGGDGSYGVFTSSVSHTSNVDGKPQTFRQATTTVNNNGKVSTYTVKNP